MPNLIFSLFLFALFSMLLVIRQRQQICQTKKTNLKKASITCTLHQFYIPYSWNIFSAFQF